MVSDISCNALISINCAMDPIVQAPTVCGRAGNSKACLSSTLHSNPFSLSLQDADADLRRECVLKSLIIYLGECVEDLIKEYTVCPNLFSLRDEMQL